MQHPYSPGKEVRDMNTTAMKEIISLDEKVVTVWLPGTAVIKHGWKPWTIEMPVMKS